MARREWKILENFQPTLLIVLLGIFFMDYGQNFASLSVNLEKVAASFLDIKN